MAVAWLLMALTHDAGTSADHVVLLWPFPILFAAIALASLPWRTLAWTAASVMIAMNLLVINQYVAQFEQDGAGDVFSDAFYPLSASLDAYADQRSTSSIGACTRISISCIRAAWTFAFLSAR